MTDSKDTVKQLRETADWTQSSFRESYSGRAMFGTSCVGIVTDDPDGVLQEIGSRGLDLTVKRDSMGLRTILYFPNVSIDA